MDHLIEVGLVDPENVKRVVLFRRAPARKVRVDEYQDEDKLWDYDNRKRIVVDSRDFGVEFKDGSKERLTVDVLHTAGDAAFRAFVEAPEGRRPEIHERTIEQVANHVGIDWADSEVDAWRRIHAARSTTGKSDPRSNWMIDVAMSAPEFLVVRRTSQRKPLSSGFYPKTEPLSDTMSSWNLLERARDHAERWRLIPGAQPKRSAPQPRSLPKKLDLGGLEDSLNHKLSKTEITELEEEMSALGHDWSNVEDKLEDDGHRIEFVGQPILAIRQYTNGKEIPEVPMDRKMRELWPRMSAKERWEHHIGIQEHSAKGHPEIRPVIMSQIRQALQNWEEQHGGTHEATIEKFEHGDWSRAYHLTVKVKRKKK
ncbi:hypothetical protein HY572_03580 [Candidatus Micrarchaeota archaeon]|nr:hypothetical protein [Candidatus Micrarchaeota archaeon]